MSQNVKEKTVKQITKQTWKPGNMLYPVPAVMTCFSLRSSA